MTHVFLLGFFLNTAVFAQKPGEEIPETYVVQPGDTCMDIAKKFFGSASEYPRLHVHNDMGPLPHNLKPGSIVRLRAGTDKVDTQDKAPQDKVRTQDKDKAALESDAVLTTFGATVNTRGAKMSEWQPAKPNQPLFRLDEVHTLSKAFANILFQDHSTLQMKQNALIIIYGGSSSKVRLSKTGGVQLLEGELGVSLADLRKPPAAIVTPSAEISVRANAALINVDATQTSRVSIQQGEAKITAKGKSVSLKSGQGTRVPKDAAPEPPSSLPEPPAWENAPPHELYVVHGTHKATAQLQWEKPLSPVRYRVEVAKDALFQNPLLETTTEDTQIPLSELEPGTFYVRTRTVNETGLVSAPSSTRRLDVFKVGEASSAQETTDGLQGEAPLQMSQELPEDILIFVNGQQVPSPLMIQHPGKYLVEFKTLDSQHSTQTEVEVFPPKFTLEIGQNQEGKPELQLHFEAAIPPDAKIWAQGLDKTIVGSFSRQDEQTFKANLFGQRPYHLHVFWGEFLLSRLQEERVEPPTPVPTVKREPVFPSHAQPVAILRERRLGSMALPTPFLPQEFQLNTALDMDFFKEKERGNALRLSARLDGPFRQGSYFANLALVNYIGPNDSWVYPELAAGAQMQFPLTKQWTAGFASDFSGNLNIHRSRQESLLRLRAMGVLGYQAGAFSVSTTQGIAGEYANSLRAAWIGSISASWCILPKFLLAAQVDGQKTASKGFASAAAAGFRFLVGPVEMGLTGHAGLTSEGRSQWGDYGASLTLGIR